MNFPRLKKALITAGALVALDGAIGCSNEPDEDLVVNAHFVSFMDTSASLSCSGGNPCSSRLVIDAAGHVSNGQDTGMLSPADTKHFAVLATGSEFIAALRSGKDCHPTSDGASYLSIRVAPSVEVTGSASCSGIVADITNAADTLAAQAFGYDPPGLPIVWSDPTPARIAEPAVFQGFDLLRTPVDCPDGEQCVTGTSVSDEGFIASGNAHGQVPEQALADFAAQVVSPSTLAALMQEVPCAPSATETATLRLGVAKGIDLVADVAGCEDGPVAELLEAAADLVTHHAEVR